MLEDIAEVLEILKNEGFAQGVVFGVADQHQKQHPGEQRAGGKKRSLENQQEAGKQAQPNAKVDRQRCQRPLPEGQHRWPQ
jgi:hypothetical protein